MGCCFSRSSSAADDASSPYPPVSSSRRAHHAPDASSRNITASSPSQPGSLSSPRGSHSRPAASERRPNVPLKPIDSTHRSKLPNTLASPTRGSRRVTHVAPLSDSVSGAWTRARLEKERNDWWDTRTTGSLEIWSALRLMVSSLQSGDVRGAQALLDATECTCPNGMLWRGVFDNRGEWYKVPEWIVVEPEGLVEENEVGVIDGEVGSSGGEEDEDKEVEVERLGEAVKVRCRLSSSGQDVRVDIRKGERVAGLIAKLKVKAGISPFASVRLVYGGRIFDESQPLESHPFWNYDNKHVLVAMVFE